jgi:hypothetical protein
VLFLGVTLVACVHGVMVYNNEAPQRELEDARYQLEAWANDCAKTGQHLVGTVDGKPVCAF